MTVHIIHTSEARGHFLKEFLAKPLPLRVEVEKYVEGRSLPQNDLAHVWFHEIATFTGHTPEETKQFMSDMFIRPRVVSVAGHSRLVKPGTSALNKEEMTAFLDRIEAWAATELGLTLRRTQ